MANQNIDHLKSEGDINLSPRRQQWWDECVNAETHALLQRDKKVFLHQSLSTPCLNALEACEGIYLQDLQGKRYMDFHGNNVHQVGFGHPKVIEAINKQLNSLSFCTRRYTNEPAVRLAEKLTELAPGNLNKVLFAPGGTSAIGMALKLARGATGRFKTISMWDSFHGASLDAISIGGEAIFRNNAGPLLPGTEHAPPPNPSHCVFECGTECNLKCTNYIDYILEKEGDVSAVIAETIRSTPYIPPKDYWYKVRASCDHHNALLILDEIPHCLGRTGKMFTCENYDVVPDMLVIGKGLGGGVFPLAALIVKEELDVMQDRALGHYTHEKNPVACAAALATIEVIETEGLLEHAREVGTTAMQRLQQMKAAHPLIGDIRGLGLFIGIELIHPENNQPANDAAEAVMYQALRKGLSFKTTMGNILTLSPPLIITQDEMNQALDIIEASIHTVESDLL